MIARFTMAEHQSPQPSATTILGTLPNLHVGEMLRLTGEWQTHPVHGRNFRVERFELDLPAHAEGIERYLASGPIRGIGPMTAKRIVEQFGDQTIDIIDQQPDLLRRVSGISAKRLDVIKQAWRDQTQIRELMMFLQSYGVSVALASRIFHTLGERSLEMVRADPYQLAHDVNGIGFRTADGIATRLGISPQSPSRYVAGLRYVLSEATDDGHVFLDRLTLLEKARSLLDAPVPDLEPALLELLRRGDAILDEEQVYLTAFFRAESGAARLLTRINQTPSALTLDPRFSPKDVIQRAGAAQGLVLAYGQLQAAEQALTQKVSILTGGPGTGKTSTLRTIITALESAGVTFCLCAPTGRAAKRVAETTGRGASTIHRLMEYQPSLNTFAYNKERPLPFDFVIVDEVSMLDILLFYHLLKAVPPESHLLLVGDADQLPAVGPGNVLRDLIESDTIATVRLTELFRQARGSQIVLAAHSINCGNVPEITNDSDHDLFFVPALTEQLVVEAIKKLLLERIPMRFGLDPVEDVQVISPMHGGLTGVSNLNSELQQLLNPPSAGKSELLRGDRVYRFGDKVMQIRNNYDKDVYNGDVGTVVQVSSQDLSLTVAFPSAGGAIEIEYPTLDLDELVLAYAVSVHKAQGSEFPCIVMPIVARHYILLRRTLLYTAISRARQLCVLVGSARALATAVHDRYRQPRNTRLAARVRRPERQLTLPDGL